MKRNTLLLLTIILTALSWEGIAQSVAGSTCTNPIVVSAMPFNNSGNTSTFGNNYNDTDFPPLAPGAITDGTSPKNYLNGHDAVFSYTAGANGSINITASGVIEYSGLFVFTGCPFNSTVGYHVWPENDLSIQNLPVTEGQTYYIVISTWPPPNNTNFNLTITGTNPADSDICLAPTNLTANNQTLDSVDLNWSENGSATNWEVLYGSKGFNPQNEGTSIPVSGPNSSITLMNLNHSTEYQAYVRSICEVNDESVITGPINFSTLCGTASIPYSLPFETGANCTTRENAGSGNNWQLVQGNQSGFSGVFARYPYSISQPANAWIYTAEVLLTAGTIYEISYKYGGSGNEEKLKVAYGTTNHSSEMTTILADHPSITGSTPAYNTVSFTVSTTDTYYIGFNAYSDTYQGYLYLDEVSIEETSYSGYVYDNGWLLPSGDPSGVSTETDDITIVNGTASLTADTDVANLLVMDGATLNINNVLSLHGNLTIDGELIFVSNATSNGELAEVSQSSIISGNATVQRYMQNKRSYRMVSSAVTTTTSIHANWQEGVNNTNTTPAGNQNPNPGFGTHITGNSSGANGFDATITGNPSMFTVDVENQQFSAVANTNATTLVAGSPYLLFVRGSREIDLTNDLASGETTLRATGLLHTGANTQTFASANSGDLVMFGNPYQSTVDINSVFSEASNINSNYLYVYDPSLGDHGSYVTIFLPEGGNTSGSQANQFLQPGQAAQVAVTGPATITFNENDKAPGNFTSTNATNSRLSSDNMLSIQLFTTENFNNGGPTHDSFGMIFNDNHSSEITPADAIKPMNFNENFGRNIDGTYLSLEHREMPKPAEVFPIFSNGYRHSEYTIAIKMDGLEDAILYLDDHFTGTSTPIENETIYSFHIDKTNDLSIATNRFSIRTEARLGVDDSLLSEVRLFPNPINDNTFYINAPKLDGKQVVVSMSDMSGRLILEDTFNCKSNTISVSINKSISSGVYLVTLKHNGEESAYRLIKK
ncbi:MAG TPA: T9SS type A sorting domain-containing protein [Aequorivita sp.]|nr:T9SS type A sorting domain-containing protein [Aequorivita sp.]